MIANEGSTYPILDSLDDDRYEEEWKVVMNTKGEYILSKIQALGLKQEIASGNRGIILFQSFSISIPYIAEFFRVKRFLKDSYQLPATASEPEYQPIPAEKWEEMKRNLYQKMEWRTKDTVEQAESIFGGKAI